LRISRGDGGGLFVLAKEGSPLLDWLYICNRCHYPYLQGWKSQLQRSILHVLLYASFWCFCEGQRTPILKQLPFSVSIFSLITTIAHFDVAKERYWTCYLVIDSSVCFDPHCSRN
jgi:hypothetical protein